MEKIYIGGMKIEMEKIHKKEKGITIITLVITIIILLILSVLKNIIIMMMKQII